MITKNFETNQKVLWGYLLFLFGGGAIGYLFYQPSGAVSLVAGFDLGFVSGLILVLSLLLNTLLGILMKYTKIPVNFDLHVILGAFTFALGVLHAVYNYAVLY